MGLWLPWQRPLTRPDKRGTLSPQRGQGEVVTLRHDKKSWSKMLTQKKECLILTNEATKL